MNKEILSLKEFKITDAFNIRKQFRDDTYHRNLDQIITHEYCLYLGICGVKRELVNQIYDLADCINPYYYCSCKRHDNERHNEDIHKNIGQEIAKSLEGK